MENVDKGNFKGVTESDDTFFLQSSKGSKLEDRSPRKQGGSASKKGINNEQVDVIVTADRDTELDLTVARFLIIKKMDIERAIVQRISEETILGSNGHVSNKGFAIDKEIEHHAIRVDLKQYVKQKIYNVQHVNAIDSRLKKWIEYQFGGVSTKYLQKHLNWFKAKEKLKTSKDFLIEFADKSLENITRNRYMLINQGYEELMQLTTQN